MPPVLPLTSQDTHPEIHSQVPDSTDLFSGAAFVIPSTYKAYSAYRFLPVSAHAPNINRQPHEVSELTTMAKHAIVHDHTCAPPTRSEHENGGNFTRVSFQYIIFSHTLCRNYK